MTLSRRTTLQVFGSGLGLGLLAACTPAPAAAPPAPAPAATSAPAAAPAAPAAAAPAAAVASPVAAAPAATAAPQPRSGGTLRFGTNADINRLDAHFRLNDVYYQVFDRLTQYDSTLKPQQM